MDDVAGPMAPPRYATAMMARSSARLALAALAACVACGCATQRARQAPADPARSFVDHALSMLGQPYRYGGSGPGGFDCSGLVHYAAGSSGSHLPRTTAELARIGHRVESSELLAGDLVFFREAGGKPLHVGIVVSHRDFIHAPSSGRVVRIDGLDDPYYAGHFWQARRLF